MADATDQNLVNDMSKLAPLCDNVQYGLAHMCKVINKAMSAFRESMHSICADPYMASTTVDDNGNMGFTKLLNDSLKELDVNLNKNLNAMTSGLYRAMGIVLKAHGYTSVPQMTHSYTVTINEVETFYASLANGQGVGIPSKGNAPAMAKQEIDNLVRSMEECKSQMKSTIQSNLHAAFQEETIQDAADKLGNEVIAITERGINQIAVCVEKYVTAHVSQLDAAKRAAASDLDTIRTSGAN